MNFTGTNSDNYSDGHFINCVNLVRDNNCWNKKRIAWNHFLCRRVFPEITKRDILWWNITNVILTKEAHKRRVVWYRGIKQDPKKISRKLAKKHKGSPFGIYVIIMDTLLIYFWKNTSYLTGFLTLVYL